MRLERVFLKNVGPFDELDVELRPGRDPDRADVHLFVGANGSGKTTLLHAIAYALAGPGNEAAPRDPLLLSRTREGAAIELVVGSQVLRCTRPGDPGERLSATRPGLQLGRQGPHGWDEYASSVLSDRGLQFASSAPHETLSAGLPGFAYSGVRTYDGANSSVRIEESSEPPFRGCLGFSAGDSTVDRIKQWVAETKTREAFARTDRDADAGDKAAHAVESVERAISEVTGLSFRFQFDVQRMRVSVKLDGEPLSFDQLPEGLKSILSWLGDLLVRLHRTPWVDDLPIREREFVLLLDEIDVHLHPAWQRRVLPVVERIFPRAQIIATTHSPFVVQSATDGFVYPLVLDRGRAELGAVSEAQPGMSYEAVLRGVLGVEPLFGAAVEEALQAFYKTLREVRQGAAPKRVELEEQAAKIAATGVEPRDIVARELRQLDLALKKAQHPA